MSDAAAAIAASQHNHDLGHEHEHGHGHSKHLAHHFDNMEQQYDSGKLGMWVFLATELLMFGGLFCAYAVYRANHPDVFLHAHTYLDTTLGAVNTAVLLASSLTMAWAVRASQLNQHKLLVTMLIVTLLGGAGFMVIKAIEYNSKFKHHLGPGFLNAYNNDYKGQEGYNNAAGVKRQIEEQKANAPKPLPNVGLATTPDQPYLFLDPNSNNADKAKIAPVYTGSSGLVKDQQYYSTEAAGQGQSLKASTDHGAAEKEHKEAAAVDEHASGGDTHAAHGGLMFNDMDSRLSQQRVNSFFGIYYCMTGLHGVHVLVGMGLIYWITLRAADTRNKAWIRPLPLLFAGGYLVFLWAISGAGAFMYTGVPIGILGVLWLAIGMLRTATVTTVLPGEFSEEYFAPVDLVGLYWHLVDLIWIFLFPLLYLIHGKVGS